MAHHLQKLRAIFGDSKSVVQELEQVLLLLMNDCAVNHIEAGKNWIFKNCQRVEQCTVVLDYINALARSSQRFSHRLHLVYLINDILHHAIRRQMVWMKQAFSSRVSTLLYLAYNCPDSGNLTEQHLKVSKVINLWEEKNFFDTGVIQQLRHEINNGPSVALQSSSYGQFTAQPAINQPMTNLHSNNDQRMSPSKPYHQLPAGLMTVALKIDQPPYTPIDPNSIREKPPHHRIHPSNDMLNAVDDFYAGLKLDHLKSSSATIGKDAIFTIGWEPNFLDSFYKRFQSTLEQRLQPKTSSHSTLSQQNEHKQRIDRESSPRRDRSPRREPSPRRDYSLRKRERSLERRRSRHHSRSRSPLRRSDYHRSENQSSKSRSSSDERFYGRHESHRTPSSSSSSTSSSSNRRYPPPPPVSMPMMNTGTSRMGLGHDSAPADVFDEFRKRSSYNFIKEVRHRDAAAGPKCYNCGKYGHFAKSCEAHLGKS